MVLFVIKKHTITDIQPSAFLVVLFLGPENFTFVKKEGRLRFLGLCLLLKL